MGQENWVEIFRAGNYPPIGNFTRERVDRIASRYDPKVHEAPVVIGHPKYDKPARAWVRGLKREGDVLLANYRDVAEDFSGWVKTGAYKKRSAKFYRLPNGEFYLRHVGYLGGFPPGIKGLADPEFAEAADEADESPVLFPDAQFAESGEPVELEFAGLLDQEMTTESAPSGNTNTTEELSMTEDEIKQMQEELKQARAESEQKSAKIGELEAQFAEETGRLKAESQRREIEARLDKLQSTGKVTPGMRQKGLAEFLSGQNATVECQFAEGDEGRLTPLEFAFQLLESAKPHNVMGDVYTSANAAGGGGAAEVPAEFAEAEPEKLTLWRKARAIQAEKNVSFAKALMLARN